MEKKFISLLIVMNLVLGGILLSRAAPESAPLEPQGSTAPTIVSYQGRVQVSGVPFSGTGYFKFAVVNITGDTTYWSNDGTSSGGSEPTNAVQLPVSNGLFTVLLGDTSLTGMTQQLTADVFSGYDRYLRVWFRSTSSGAFTRLTPDTRIAAVPYALQAQHAAPPGRVIVVAKSNGDFTSIQAAINSISGTPPSGNPILIWVAPGTYNEAVKLKPNVHLQGAGQGLTFIQADLPYNEAKAVELASDTSLRDLSIIIHSDVGTNYGIYANSVTGVEISDVYVAAGGNGTSNTAIYLTGDTQIMLENVTAFAGKTGGDNVGLRVTASPDGGPEVTLHGGTFTASGGTNVYGIRVYGGMGTFLGAADVRASGLDASTTNIGLESDTLPTVLLQGGFFLGSGGHSAYGIYNDAAHLEAEGVTAQGENATSVAVAFHNSTGGGDILRGGSFTANAAGGTQAWAIHNFNGAVLEAHDVTAQAWGGTTNNQGLRNEVVSSVARVYGGSFTAQGGIQTSGINNIGDLTVQGAFAFGENGTSNYGLYTLGGTVRADSCRFKGSSAAIRETDGTLYLAVSQLDGGLNRIGGTCTCFQVYDGSYNPYTCP